VAALKGQINIPEQREDVLIHYTAAQHDKFDMLFLTLGSQECYDGEEQVNCRPISLDIILDLLSHGQVFPSCNTKVWLPWASYSLEVARSLETGYDGTDVRLHYDYISSAAKLDFD
jgi:hypothetical protein